MVRDNSRGSDTRSAHRHRSLWLMVGLAAVAFAVATALGAHAFEDDDGTVHEPAIDALADRGVLAGTECGDGRICPTGDIERWVMAVWLVRALDETPARRPARFADVDPDTWWAPYVEKLSQLRVTMGCSTGPARYCPHEPVTRSQMASFLVRAFDLEPVPYAAFDDTRGHTNEADISSLAAAGITAGCSTEPARYCPDAPVTRGQMATFLARALELVPLPDTTVDTRSRERFTAVSAGGLDVCGIRTDATVACWGPDREGVLDVPEGPFVSLSTGGWHACGIRPDRTLTCWGLGESRDEAARTPGGRYADVSAGAYHSCGLRTDGVVICWGTSQRGQLGAPEGEYVDVSVGGDHACGVRRDRTITCWGTVGGVRLDAPDGRFTAVSSGHEGSCAIRTDGTMVCWGLGAPEPVDIDLGTFSDVTVRTGHACGLRTDGTAACWGSNDEGEADAPGGRFVALSAGARSTCGLRPDGTIQCWGNERYGQLRPPGGVFTTTVAGSEYACGLRLDGSIRCWGFAPGVATYLRAGSFTALDAAPEDTCGLRTDGAVVCWRG
ncbi:MAG: S-layer homology domain-containing protein, partial [bacterium]|nr:S-layer homology domain-containing protein [bacterium]